MDHESTSLRTRTTELLAAAGDAPPPPLDQLMPIVLPQLQAIAHRQLARDRGNVTLQTTALVHEAYLKLVDDDRVTSRCRAYFFAAAARAMRQVLLDAARRRRAAKRGAGAPVVTLGGEEGGTVDTFADDLLDLETALQELGRRNPRQMQVVECRYFGDMSVTETAAALDVSERTVKADWAFARAWLYDALKETPRG